MTDEPERGGKPTGEPEGLPERSTQPLPGATGITTSSDIQEDARGTGHFPTGEMSLLERMILLTRSQNPFVTFEYHSNVAIGETEEVPIHDVPPNQNAGGWIPLRNGFIAGVTIDIEDPTVFPAGQGIRFSIYRDNVEILADIYVTDDHNKNDNTGTALGPTRVIEFNTVPAGYYSEDTRDTYHFKAGDEITLRTNTVILPGLTFNTAVKGFHFFLYYVFDVTEDETLNARRYGGGNIDNTPGGGEDGGGAVGDGGMQTS